jgi:hypothetical protein
MAGRTESEQSEEQAITGDSAEPPSHLEKQIIRQVEVNLRHVVNSD